MKELSIFADDPASSKENFLEEEKYPQFRSILAVPNVQILQLSYKMDSVPELHAVCRQCRVSMKS